VGRAERSMRAFRRVLIAAGLLIVAAAAFYVLYVGASWLQYGREKRETTPAAAVISPTE